MSPLQSIWNQFPSSVFYFLFTSVITGSDDTTINIYSIIDGNIKKHYHTAHTNNIFWAKDLPNSSCESILSCAADGRVLLSNIVNDLSRTSHRHEGRAHRLELILDHPDQFFSCGEDGMCNLFDIRLENSVTGSVKFLSKKGELTEIYSISSNLMSPFEVIIGGSLNMAQV